MMPSPAWAIDCFNGLAADVRDRIDGRERWLVHNFVPAVDRDRSVPAILGVGFDSINRGWIGRPMIAVFPNNRQGGHETVVSPEITTILYVWKHWAH
jgi:hypothetical protein